MPRPLGSPGGGQSQSKWPGCELREGYSQLWESVHLMEPNKGCVVPVKRGEAERQARAPSQEEPGIAWSPWQEPRECVHRLGLSPLVPAATASGSRPCRQLLGRLPYGVAQGIKRLLTAGAGKAAENQGGKDIEKGPSSSLTSLGNLKWVTRLRGGEGRGGEGRWDLIAGHVAFLK